MPMKSFLWFILLLHFLFYFLIFVLTLLLWSFLLLIFSWLLWLTLWLFLASQFSSWATRTLVWIFLILLCLKIFVLTLIVISLSNQLYLLLLFSFNSNRTTLKIFNQCIKFTSFDSHKFDIFFLLFQRYFEIELFIGCIYSVELYNRYILDSEIENWLRNKDDGLLEHI